MLFMITKSPPGSGHSVRLLLASSAENSITPFHLRLTAAASQREADDVVLAGIVETSGSHYDADGDADETVGLPSGPKDEVTCSRASAMGSSADSSCGPGDPFTVMTPCRQLESSESVLVR